MANKVIDLKPIPLGKLITFPSNGGGEKFKCCLHERHDVLNTSVRNPGASPGFGGAEGDLLQVIVDRLGMDCDYYIPGDDGWGRKIENNIWTGCRGMLQRKNVDFVLGSHMKHHWINVFAHSSVSYRNDQIRFYSKLPPATTTPDVIIKTFDTGLWISIGAFIFLVAFVFYWMQGKRYTMVDQCFSRFAELLLQEPVAKINSSLALELLCVFWTISAQFIALSYMAVILGIMMMPKRAPSLDNDDKLLEAVRHGKVKVATPVENPTFLPMMIYNHRIKYVEMANLIVKNKWIVHVDKDSIVNYIENDWALALALLSTGIYFPNGYQYVVSKDYVYEVYLSPITSRSWPLKARLETLVTRVVEHGIHMRDYEEWVYMSRLRLGIKSAPETSSGIRALTLTHLQGAFMLYGSGFGISAIALVYEILSFSISKSNKKQKVETHVNEFEIQSQIIDVDVTAYENHG